MPSAPPILELDLGKNGIRTFASLDEAREFLASEWKAWRWLAQSPVQENLGMWSNINQHFQQIQNHIEASNGREPNLANLKAAFENCFRQNRMPLTTSPVGEFIFSVRQEDDPVTAAAALSSWLNFNLSLSQFSHLKGAVLMAAFDAGITKRTPGAVKRSLEGLLQKFEDERNSVRRDTVDQRKTFDTDRKKHRSLLASVIRRNRRMAHASRARNEAFTQAFAKDVSDLSTSAISDLKGTELLYKEQMRLKGPVEYWTSKAAAHRAATVSFRRWLIGFSFVAGAGLLGALYWIGNHAVEVASADKPPAVYLVLVTLGVVLTTMVFWAARILTRLFLSEHHLAIDAEERAVMTQTYLALTAEGQAQESERSIVLSALFRPTADGIVKDDAAPDISPAALLSKLGSR